MNTAYTFEFNSAAVTQATMEQALQINRGLSPIIKALQRLDSARAIEDAHKLQQILIKFLRLQNLEMFVQELRTLDEPLREHCFVAVIKNSGILPLVAIAGM